MKISAQVNDEGILRELGARLAGARLDRNLTQAQLAEQAGVSKRTVERMESGGVATHLSGFIRVCRVLGVLDRFDLLVPEPQTSPLEQLKLQGRRRQRASKSRQPDTAPGKWRWGDES